MISLLPESLLLLHQVELDCLINLIQLVIFCYDHKWAKDSFTSHNSLFALLIRIGINRVMQLSKLVLQVLRQDTLDLRQAVLILVNLKLHLHESSAVCRDLICKLLYCTQIKLDLLERLHNLEHRVPRLPQLSFELVCSLRWTHSLQNSAELIDFSFDLDQLLFKCKVIITQHR